MRKLIASVAFIAAISAGGAASAQLQPYGGLQGYGSTQAPRTSRSYDMQSGNSITTTTKPGGGATIRGNNLMTGSTWRTEVLPNGNQRGTDSDGNMWNYNQRSGSYLNSNGTVCMGKGALRTCN